MFDNKQIEQRLCAQTIITLYGCWELQGAPQNKTGHRRISINGVREYGHRLGWRISNNGVDIPDHRMVCHTCDNPACWNFDHLYLGDSMTNRKDSDCQTRN